MVFTVWTATDSLRNHYSLCSRSAERGALLFMRDHELSFEYRVLGVQLMSMNGFKINPKNLEKYVYGLYYEIYVHL